MAYISATGYCSMTNFAHDILKFDKSNDVNELQ